LDIKNTSEVAENIFALVDGAYYYLGLVDDKEELNRRLEAYKRLAICILEIDTP
jgi:hypothetical protein